MAKMLPLSSKHDFMTSTMLLIVLLIATINSSSANVGVCFGGNGNNLPSKQETIDLYKQHNIQRMRIYSAESDTLQALDGSNIELILGVPIEDHQRLASSQSEADMWVQNNIKSHTGVRFRYLAVGNEITANDNRAQYLVPAMRNLQTALDAAGHGDIKVSSAIAAFTLSQSFPPSSGSFGSDYKQAYLDGLIGFLAEKNSPLLLNVYPYFSYADPNSKIALDYALFTAAGTVVTDQSLQYQNLFDAMMDAVYSALEKSGGGNVEIVVSETGWPTGGGGEATNVDNAKTYNSNLIQHLNNGTPKRPGKPIEAYLFAMFDENQKPVPPEVERFWGLFNPDTKQLKYDINFG